MGLEMKAAIELEAEVCKLIEMEKQMKSLKEAIDKKRDTVICVLVDNDISVHTFEINDETISVELKEGQRQKLSKEILAEEVGVEPEDLKMEFMLKLANEHKLTPEMYKKSYTSVPTEALKVKSKKTRKKAPKNKK